MCTLLTSYLALEIVQSESVIYGWEHWHPERRPCAGMNTLGATFWLHLTSTTPHSISSPSNKSQKWSQQSQFQPLASKERTWEPHYFQNNFKSINILLNIHTQIFVYLNFNIQIFVYFKHMCFKYFLNTYIFPIFSHIHAGSSLTKLWNVLATLSHI